MAGTNLGTAYVSIMPSTKGFAGALSSDMKSAGSSAGASLGGSIASVAMKAIAAAGIGMAVKKLFSEAIEAGAALQQSFGGLDTIYGEASANMKDMAYNAAQAGITANDYAEQAVSFGASLKQAFGGDTVKAAEAANTAILDMADNAAKMGTPIENIQTAYQGFARGQYQLLDNLKLGYGGTKEEMERLLADAQALTGVEYNIDNLGDVYEAIHVIQGELGLTGVAAQEGAETFSGSMAAMKASAENLLANLALGENIEEPLTALIENVGNFLFNNLFPMIGNIISQLPGLIGDGLMWAFQNIPNAIDAIINFLNNLTAGIENNSGAFKEKMVEIGHQALEMFKNIDWAGLGMAIINLLWAGIQAIAPVIWELLQWIGTTAWEWFKSVDWAGLGNAIINLLLEGIQALGNLIWEGLKSLGNKALEEFKGIDWVQLGKDVINFIIEGLADLGSLLWETVTGLAQDAWDAFVDFDWFGLGGDIVNGVVDGIGEFGSTIGDTLLGWAQDAWNAVVDFFSIGSPSKLMRDTVGKWIPLGMAEGIEDEGQSVVDAMNSIAADTATAIDTDFAYNATADALEGGQTAASGIVINVYPSAGMDERQLADLVQQRLTFEQRQRQAAWGTA